MNVFILEDEDVRMPYFFKFLDKQVGKCEIAHAKSVAKAKTLLLRLKKFDWIFLDHDLGDKEDGVEVAKFIVEKSIKYRHIYIHSMNVVGAHNIKAILPDANIFPFSKVIEGAK